MAFLPQNTQIKLLLDFFKYLIKEKINFCHSPTWDNGSRNRTVKAVFNKKTPSFTHGSKLLLVGGAQFKSLLSSRKIFSKVGGM